MDADADADIGPGIPAAELPEAPRRYASEGMSDRRRRILAEARALLEASGVEGFTMRALSLRAGVAPRTLYNAFGGKEDLIAAAIHEHFAALLEELPPPPAGEDIEGQLRVVRAVAERVLTLGAYASAMVGVFFSPAVDRRIYDTLRWISVAASGGWVERAEAAGFLVTLAPGEREHLVTLIMNTSYANVTDWVSGRILADTFVGRTVANFLLNIHGFVREAHRAEADRLLLSARAEMG